MQAASAERPNVVFILSDDLGWGSVGCYGADPDLISTPNIDRLAREGRRFTDANTTSSVCSPTRYAVLTGRYCWRTPLQSEVLGTTSPLHIETDRLTMASMLKKLGYTTAAVGKWHLGYGSASVTDYTQELKPGPLEIGFDYHFGVPANHGDVAGVYVEDHWVYGLDKASPSEPSQPYLTMKERKAGVGPRGPSAIPLNAPRRVDEEVMAVTSQKAADWIRRQPSEKPFFLYFTPVAVHNPITPSKESTGQSKAGPYGDFIHDLDLGVGTILKALEEKGCLDETLIVFSSDNGGVNRPTGESEQNQARDAGLKPVGPFRGGKHNVWEGGFRVPYIVRWPGHVPAGTVCEETVSLVDSVASLAAIVGVELPPVEVGAEDSVDVSAAWLGKDYEKPLRRDVIVHSADGNFAIRKGPWKWIEGVPAYDVKPGSLKSRADEFNRMLFDLSEDIAEAHEVESEHPEVVTELEALLNRYRDGGYSRELPAEDVKPKPDYEPLPALVGEPVLELSFNAVPKRPWRTAPGRWTAQDGAVWGDPGREPGDRAGLTGPVGITDGTIEYEFNLPRGAARHSQRIAVGDGKHSFRVVVSAGRLEVSKNPEPGQGQEVAQRLIDERVRLRPGVWHTLRMRFQGDEISVQVAGIEAKAKHPIFAEPKKELNFLTFDGVVGFRHLVVVR